MQTLGFGFRVGVRAPNSGFQDVLSNVQGYRYINHKPETQVFQNVAGITGRLVHIMIPPAGSH